MSCQAQYEESTVISQNARRVVARRACRRAERPGLAVAESVRPGFAVIRAHRVFASAVNVDARAGGSLCSIWHCAGAEPSVQSAG